MIRLPITRLQSKSFLFGMILLMLSACALDPAHDPRNVLSESIHWYNAKFEGKLMDTVVAYVRPSDRPEFVMKSQDIRDKVSFFDSALVDMQFYKGDFPALMDGQDPEKEFDRAVVVMRYRLSILPSNTLKNIIVEQEWNKIDGGWYVSPNLDKFFAKEEPPQSDPKD
jgi:hypothetical protein